jgi:hypothetical protein
MVWKGFAPSKLLPLSFEERGLRGEVNPLGVEGIDQKFNRIF